MKIDKAIVYTMEYEDKDYIRFGKLNWMCRYGESLETEYSMEDALENIFQENIKIHKDIGMI